VKLFQAQSSNYYDPYFLQDQFRIMQSEIILYPVIANLELNTRLAAARRHRHAAQRHHLPLPRGQDAAHRVPRSSSLIEINVFAQDAGWPPHRQRDRPRLFRGPHRPRHLRPARGPGPAQEGTEAQERIVTVQRDVVEKLRKDLNISGVDLNARYSDMEIETLRQMQNSLIALSVDAIGRKTRWERFKAIPVEDRLSLVNSELIQDRTSRTSCRPTSWPTRPSRASRAASARRTPS
jgi:succinoglycan biosynthesis transport protein ExoP